MEPDCTGAVQRQHSVDEELGLHVEHSSARHGGASDPPRRLAGHVGDEREATGFAASTESGSPARMPRGVPLATRSTPAGSASPVEPRPGKRSERRPTMPSR